jgi:ribosome-associated translation inhibitor RaiA
MQNTPPAINTVRKNKHQSAMDTVEAIENDREFKAHIYQQLVDIQPFLTPESQVAVSIQLEQDPPSNEMNYVLTLTTFLGEYRVEVEGRSSDVYESFGEAKSKLIRQLDEVYGAAIDSTEREVEIQSLLSGELTLH